MKKIDALNGGFEFEGRFGLVPVYLTGPINSTSPGVAVRGPDFMEYVLDVQMWIYDVILTIADKVKPDHDLAIPVYYYNPIEVDPQ